MPELQPLYQKHIQDNGELLPYPFMGDVTRFVITECGRAAGGQSQADLFIGRFLIMLEGELGARNKETVALIALGFCENLSGEAAALGVLQSRMGPLLTASAEPFL